MRVTCRSLVRMACRLGPGRACGDIRSPPFSKITQVACGSASTTRSRSFRALGLSPIKRHDGGPVGVVIGIAEDSAHNIWAETMGPPGTLIRIQDLKVREELPAPQMPLARTSVPPIRRTASGWAW